MFFVCQPQTRRIEEIKGEPSARDSRQKRRQRADRMAHSVPLPAFGMFILVVGMSMLLAPTVARAGEAGSSTPLGLAERAVAQMAHGNYKAAARQARLALEASPDDASLHILAGTILLNTHDWRGAQAAFTQASAADSADPLASYGRGLAQLAYGDRAAAPADFAQSEQNGGDAASLLIARRYAQWLAGAQIDIGGAGLPDAFTAAQHGLEGMALARQGDWNRAAAALQAAETAMAGDPTTQPSGLLMTFDAANPLDTAAPPLSPNSGLNRPLPKERAVGGEIQIEPGDLTASVAYATYAVDGQIINLVNVYPFQCVWDSSQVGNGLHTLTITLSDANGREITRLSRRLRLFNTGAHARSKEVAARWTQVRAALWKALALHPDRCVCAYMRGTACRALGEAATACKQFACAAAIRPDYRDTRRQLAAFGELGAAGEAMWGGLPTEKVVALTFDDGPKPGMTEELLDILRQERVPATFFVIGRHVTAYPTLTRKIADAGMEIANHSYTHPNLTRLPEAAVARELLRTQAAVQAATGKTPRFLRPPGGDWNASVAAVARHWGLTPCMWTVDAYAAEVIGAQQVADAVLSQVQPGSIILMHNGKMSTVQALPTIIRELRKRGYSFATVDTLARRLSAAKAAARQAARANGMAAGRRAE